MGTVSIVFLFLIYLLVTAAFFSVAHLYGNFIATLTGGMFYFHLVLLCLVLLIIWAGWIFFTVKYLRYATKKHNMFKKVDKYGLKSTSAFGIGTLAVLSIAMALIYVFMLLNKENPVVRATTFVIVISYAVLNYIGYIWMWGRCQTYQWCPKCGRFWGKSYYVADEIGRETHEFRYKERERASTVENAKGELVASVYNDVEKTGYNVRYYYRLRHHCKYCGDWEEQINIDKPTMFDGAWIEPYDSHDVTEHINVTLTGTQPQMPESPATPIPPAQNPTRLNGAVTGNALNDVALQQLYAPEDDNK
ncbi:MAG: hypothetical protein J5993_02885 [Clostridia bacterium]|nr:hypothetical protein [Clostridia bacterium]